VLNRHDFKDLSDLNFEWELAESGVVIATGKLGRLATAARGRDPVRIKMPRRNKPGAEYHLTIRARARAGTIPGVAEGHIVAWDQFALPSGSANAATLQRGVAAKKAVPGPVVVTERPESVRLAAGETSLLVDRQTGLITYFDRNGTPLLWGGAPNFWRALTDNDIGAGIERSHAVWKEMSEKRKTLSVSIRNVGTGSREVVVEHELGEGAARFRTSYRMSGTGSVSTTGHFQPIKRDLPDPLRMGLAFEMPDRVSQVEYFGRGPHESYADRKTSARVGIWKGPISAQHHDYMRPQETGNKTDVRWMHLFGASGAGLLVRGDAPLSMNVLGFRYDELSRRAAGTRHSSDIVVDGPVSLLVDAAQVGVGGDTSWDNLARAHQKYRIKVQPHSFGFTFEYAAPTTGG
jgi:beta-galactosidase